MGSHFGRLGSSVQASGLAPGRGLAGTSQVHIEPGSPTMDNVYNTPGVTSSRFNTGRCPAGMEGDSQWYQAQKAGTGLTVMDIAG